MKTYISKIDGQWYAFGGDLRNDQVYSLGSDNPKDGGCWFARWTISGIRYVSSPSPTRSAAYQKARRHGQYEREV